MQTAEYRDQDVIGRQPGEFDRHRGPVTCVSCVPHSDIAVTSGYDGAVGWFDLATGEVDVLGYHDHLVNRITVNTTGTRAASVSSDYTVYIWDLESKCLERALLGHADDVEDFVFVDDNTGVSVSRDARIFVWALDSGVILRVIEGHEKDVLSVAYSNGLIYSSGDDMTLRVWNVDDGRLVRRWGPFEHETDSCAVDPLRGRAILGCDDGKLRVFDIDSGATVATIQAHASGIKKVAISPANGNILSVAYDQRACIRDAVNFQRKLELEPHSRIWERSFNWSPDGDRLVAGTFDGTVVAWSAASGTREFEIGNAGQGNSCLNDVAATNEGEFVTVSDDGILRLGRMTDGEAGWVGEAMSPEEPVLANAVAIDGQSSLVIAGAHDHTVSLFDLGPGELRYRTTRRLDEGPINAIRILNRGDGEIEFFCACYSGAIVRLDRDGNVLDRFTLHEGAVKSLSLHPHESFGASCSADGALLAWDFEGRLIRTYPGHMAIVDDVDFDPEGKRIASVSRDFTAKVYDFLDGRLLHSISLGHRSPKAVCFWSPTEIIATNYWGAVIRVDLESGMLEQRSIASNGISAVNRCGGYAIAVSYDGSVHLLDPHSLESLASLQTMTQRLRKSRLI